MIFEATTTGGLYGNIALDDITYVPDGTCAYFNSTTTVAPTTTQTPSSKLQCNFESNFCDWYADPSTSSRWVRRSAENAKFGEAPLNDITLQNSQGYYAYVGSNYAGDASLAVLKSPSIDFVDRSCLEFWYQMGGQVNTKLTVNIRNNANKTSVWNRNGNLDDTWAHAYVNLAGNITIQQWIEFEGKFKKWSKNFSQLKSFFHLIIKGNVSNKNVGFVAIDDVAVLNGRCPAPKFCDFETWDICNYKYDPTGDFQWTRSSGRTFSLETGPSFDHTYQTSSGHYMYIEASDQYYGKTQKKTNFAKIISYLL